MNKKVLIAVVLILAFIVIVVVLFTNRSEAPVADINSSTNTSAAYTLEEIAVHNKMADCWTIINDGVYNITNYVPVHPGGDEILKTCGTDGTSMFTERKTDSGETIGSGTPHSNNAENQLAEYKIGTLSQ